MQKYPFQLYALPYEYGAMEPNIEEECVNLHYSVALKNYVETLNRLLRPYPAYQGWDLQKLACECGALPEEIRMPVRVCAGGIINHELFFNGLKNGGNTEPSHPLSAAIDRSFGSFANFQKEMKKKANALVGSGYVFLAVNKTPEHFGELALISLINEDTLHQKAWQPILVIDVWEHAYFLEYQYSRCDYVENWLKIINWEEADRRYLEFEAEK